jgi:hypothetical protein
MATNEFSPKNGDLVTHHSHEKGLVFQVIGVQVGGDKCFIQEFDVSHRRLVGNPQLLVSAGDLLPFKEDASQAAARIVREATKD